MPPLCGKRRNPFPASTTHFAASKNREFLGIPRFQDKEKGLRSSHSKGCEMGLASEYGGEMLQSTCRSIFVDFQDQCIRHLCFDSRFYFHSGMSNSFRNKIYSANSAQQLRCITSLATSRANAPWNKMASRASRMRH